MKFSGPPPRQGGVGVGAAGGTDVENQNDDPCFQPPPDEYIDATPNELCIFCIAGRGLPAMDSFLFG